MWKTRSNNDRLNLFGGQWEIGSKNNEQEYVRIGKELTYLFKEKQTETIRD